MLGHSFGEWKDDGDGSTHSRTCSRCILTETEAHSWGDWEFNHDANLFRNGSKTRVCSVCGGTQTDKANHTSWLSRVFYPIYLFFCNFFNKIVYGASLNWLFPEKTIPYEI